MHIYSVGESLKIGWVNSIFFHPWSTRWGLRWTTHRGLPLPIVISKTNGLLTWKRHRGAFSWHVSAGGTIQRRMGHLSGLRAEREKKKRRVSGEVERGCKRGVLWEFSKRCVWGVGAFSYVVSGVFAGAVHGTGSSSTERGYGTTLPRLEGYVVCCRGFWFYKLARILKFKLSLHAIHAPEISFSQASECSNSIWEMEGSLSITATERENKQKKQFKLNYLFLLFCFLVCFSFLCSKLNCFFVPITIHLVRAWLLFLIILFIPPAGQVLLLV